MALQEEREQEWRENARADYCPHCHGRGYLTVDSGGAGPAYACPDCEEE